MISNLSPRAQSLFKLIAQLIDKAIAQPGVPVLDALTFLAALRRDSIRRCFTHQPMPQSFWASHEAFMALAQKVRASGGLQDEDLDRFESEIERHAAQMYRSISDRLPPEQRPLYQPEDAQGDSIPYEPGEFAHAAQMSASESADDGTVDLRG